MSKNHSKHCLFISTALCLFVFLELTFMFICGGNFVVDTLIFNDFRFSESLEDNSVLKDNQYIVKDTVYTTMHDSIDFNIYIDRKLIYRDTLYKDKGYILERNSIWLRPGHHNVKIKSKALNTSCVYSVRNFLFMEIFVERMEQTLSYTDNRPLFVILNKHFLPIKRKEI